MGGVVAEASAVGVAEAAVVAVAVALGPAVNAPATVAGAVAEVAGLAASWVGVISLALLPLQAASNAPARAMVVMENGSRRTGSDLRDLAWFQCFEPCR